MGGNNRARKCGIIISLVLNRRKISCPADKHKTTNMNPESFFVDEKKSYFTEHFRVAV